MAFEDVKTNELVVPTIANLVKAAKLATDDIKAPSYAVLRIYKSTYQKKKRQISYRWQSVSSFFFFTCKFNGLCFSVWNSHWQISLLDNKRFYKRPSKV